MGLTPTPGGGAGAGASGAASGSGGAASGACQPCATASKPCAGLGMGAQKQVDAFADDMGKLKQDWPTLTPDARRSAMQGAVDKTAGAAGFPAPRVKLDPSLGPGRNGELQFGSWDIAINNQLAAANSISDSAFAQLSDTIYHETRHAEQWYLIARRDAGDGMTAAQIMTARQISNPAVAAEAVKAPLKPPAPQRACADSMYNSVYGTGAAARNAVLRALPVDRAALQAAAAKAQASNAAYTAITGNPIATAAQKAAALATAQADYAAYTAAKTVSDAGYLAYRSLPEEADAWDAGGRAAQAVTKKLGELAKKGP